MKFTHALRLLAAFGFAAALANAGKINFLCDGSVDVAACGYLNNNVAGE